MREKPLHSRGRAWAGAAHSAQRTAFAPAACRRERAEPGVKGADCTPRPEENGTAGERSSRAAAARVSAGAGRSGCVGDPWAPPEVARGPEGGKLSSWAASRKQVHYQARCLHTQAPLRARGMKPAVCLPNGQTDFSGSEALNTSWRSTKTLT